MSTRRHFLHAGLGACSLGLASCAAKPAEPVALGPWSGAVTPSGFRVKAKMARAGVRVRLRVSSDEAGTRDVHFFGPVQAADENDRLVDLSAAELQPHTQYHYALEADGVIQPRSAGRVQTFPVEGRAASFHLAFASCNQGSSRSHDVLGHMRESAPLFYLCTGDFFYGNINVNDRSRYRRAYADCFADRSQAALYRSTPLVHMWDDHDYGPSNSDSNARGREASRLTYQEYQCHYPLPAGRGNVPIYQSFVVGRVRVILSDLRSERRRGTMLGTAQKAWLKEQFLAARDREPLILWASSVPWIDTVRPDSWAGFREERREIADFLKDNRIRGVCILSGDAHMLAADDGRNADYATGGGMPIPVLQAAAIDSSPSVKGGPYSVRPVPGSSQYGHLEIEDSGHRIHVRFVGRKVGRRVEEPVALRFSVVG